jgi:hypothetical protein
MPVFQVQIAPALYEQLGRGPLTFSNKAEAEKHWENAFKAKGMNYEKESSENSTTYKNEHGGTLAKIIIAPNQPGFHKPQ